MGATNHCSQSGSNFQTPFFDLKNKNFDKNALLSCSTMCVVSIDTTFMTNGAAVVNFYSFVWAVPTAVVNQEVILKVDFLT